MAEELNSTEGKKIELMNEVFECVDEVWRLHSDVMKLSDLSRVYTKRAASLWPNKTLLQLMRADPRFLCVRGSNAAWKIGPACVKEDIGVHWPTAFR